jgi:hypothetical protein
LYLLDAQICRQLSFLEINQNGQVKDVKLREDVKLRVDFGGNVFNFHKLEDLKLFGVFVDFSDLAKVLRIASNSLEYFDFEVILESTKDLRRISDIDELSSVISTLKALRHLTLYPHRGQEKIILPKFFNPGRIFSSTIRYLEIGTAEGHLINLNQFPGLEVLRLHLPCSTASENVIHYNISQLLQHNVSGHKLLKKFIVLESNSAWFSAAHNVGLNEEEIAQGHDEFCEKLIVQDFAVSRMVLEKFPKVVHFTYFPYSHLCEDADRKFMNPKFFKFLVSSSI